MSDYLDSLDQVIRDVIAPSAEETDRTGTFPTTGLQALGNAGLLGLLSAKDVGGSGHGVRAAADVVERLGAACGSTAMVVMMHYAAVPTIEALGPRDVREAIAGGSHLATLALSEAGWTRRNYWHGPRT